jgi:F-type H+-transporting ATPase subunit delta
VSDITSVSGVSGRYATALFELADEAGSLDEIDGQLGRLAQALEESADLRTLIDSPLYSRDEQGRAMAAICKALEVGPPTANMVALMAQKRRLFALPDVIRGFRALLAKKRGTLTAEIRSPKPLTDAQRSSLASTLKNATGSDVVLDVTVDESLIGGLVVKVGSRMIDTSIRSRLDRLQTAMKETAL